MPRAGLVACGLLLTSTLQAQEPPAFDPFAGMDQDGRIPQMKPADLPNRERWRYVPEGRLKPGGPVDRFLVSTFVAPMLFYEEAVGAGGGVAFTDIDFRNQRRAEFLGLFVAWTTQGQERYSAVWQRWLNQVEVPGGGVATQERTWVRVTTGYERTRTRRFYGFGADTTADDETSYTDEMSHLRMHSQATLTGDWVASGALDVEHRNLTAGYVSDVPTTGEAFPELVTPADSIDDLTAEVGLRYDTRDSPENPYRGWSFGVGWEGPVATTYAGRGGIASVRGTWAIPLPGLFHEGGEGDEENPPTDTFAVGAFVSGTHGELPFWALPSLGGSRTLRGYIGDRFTDRAAWHASAEWRVWVIARGHAFTDTIRIERLGVAPFIDLGSVAGTPADLPEATIRYSYGVGFRAMFERSAIFRLDLGFSPEGTGVNLAFGMAF